MGRQREKGMSASEAMQERAKPLLFTMSKVTGLGVDHLLWVEVSVLIEVGYHMPIIFK